MLAHVRPFIVPDRELPGSRCLTAPTLTGLIGEVASLVEDCVENGNCFFVIEAPAQHRYVQGLIRAGSGLRLESVSNAFLANCCEHHCLGAEQERALLGLAWRSPDERSPNWYRELDITRDPAALAAELLVRTLAEVHQTHAGSRLHVAAGKALGPPNRAPVERQRRAS